MFERLGFNTTTCIRIRRNWLSVRVVAQHQPVRQYENTTLVVLQIEQNGKRTVLAVGQDAESFFSQSGKDVERRNAFDHPRLVVEDLEVAVPTLTFFLQRVFKRTVYFAPRIVVQCLRELEGGLTNIERRSLLDLVIAAGAREAFLHEEAQELSDQELLTSKPGDFQSKWKF